MNQRRNGGLGAGDKLPYTAALVALLLCEALFGQSAAPVARLRTFHIQGLIRTYDDSVVSNGRVTFEGNKFNKTVFTDSRGLYEVDLPVGLYTMTADALKMPDLRFGFSIMTTPKDLYEPSLQEYERPLFRVTSPTSLTLNITLDSAEQSCDPGYGVGPSAPPPDEEREIVCGAQDRFPIPSDDNVPFELLIRSRLRRSTEKGFLYDGTRGAGWNTPVFVAYNLFALQADHVIYDMKNKTLRATGHVVAVGFDDVAQRAESMNFKIENGQATPLR